MPRKGVKPFQVLGRANFENSHYWEPILFQGPTLNIEGARPILSKIAPFEHESMILITFFEVQEHATHNIGGFCYSSGLQKGTFLQVCYY